jgi:hypothetical protein
MFFNAIVSVLLVLLDNASWKLFYTRMRRFFIRFMAVWYSITWTGYNLFNEPLLMDI